MNARFSRIGSKNIFSMTYISPRSNCFLKNIEKIFGYHFMKGKNEIFLFFERPIDKGGKKRYLILLRVCYTSALGFGCFSTIQRIEWIMLLVTVVSSLIEILYCLYCSMSVLSETKTAILDWKLAIRWRCYYWLWFWSKRKHFLGIGWFGRIYHFMFWVSRL